MAATTSRKPINIGTETVFVGWQARRWQESIMLSARMHTVIPEFKARFAAIVSLTLAVIGFAARRWQPGGFSTWIIPHEIFT